MWFYIILTLFINEVLAQDVLSQLTSPCPEFLSYETNGTAEFEWMAVFKITSDVEVKGFQLTAKFTNKNVNYWGNDIDSFVITQPHELKPCEEFVMRFPVTYFSGKPIPSVAKLELNGKDVCPGTSMKDVIKGCKNKKPQTFQSQLKNPCPNLLRYESNPEDPNSWIGVLSITSEVDVNGFKLYVKFTNNNVQFFGTALDAFVITRTDNLKACVPFEMRFPVSFYESKEVPGVERLEVDGKDICPGPGVTNAIKRCNIQPSTTTPAAAESDESEDEIFCASIFGQKCNTAVTENRKTEVACGSIIGSAAPLITFGQDANKGQFPWHGAMFYNSKKIKQKYICGSSLVTANYAITAAHCVTRPKSSIKVKAENIVVYFGKHLLSDTTNSDIQEKIVKDIIVHPNYDGNTFTGDISLLKLFDSVDYTDYVRPICIWSEREDLSQVVDKQGTVAGWGKNENDEFNEVLTQVKMPVVNSLQCIYSNRDFYVKYLDEKSFCAGIRNGSSVCNGDSGGGMVFAIAGTSPPRYQLRGIVSLSPSLFGKCDTHQYVVFTDVAKYREWIHQNLA